MYAEVALATRDWSGQLKLPIRSKKRNAQKYIVILGQFINKMVTMLNIATCTRLKILLNTKKLHIASYLIKYYIYCKS